MNIQLKINDREFDFALGLGLIGEIIEDTGLNIDVLVKKIDSNYFKWLPYIMFESAKYAAERKGEDIDFDKFLFVDWFEKVGGLEGETVLKFYNAFNKSLTKDVPKEPEIAGESKKK